MERPSLTRVFIGTGLILLTLLTLLSITSHDANDPPADAYPRNEKVRNLCGPMGAYFAHWLFETFGVHTSFLLVFLGILWVGLFFSNRRFEQPIVRMVGIVLLVFGIIALIGGIYAIKRQKWGLALAGSILALPAGGILGILSIIFVSLGRKEFSPSQT